VVSNSIHSAEIQYIVYKTVALVFCLNIKKLNQIKIDVGRSETC